MKFKLNNREIEVNEYDGTYQEEGYIISATFVDTGIDLTDAECEELTNTHQAEIDELLFERAIMSAEDAYEDR